MVTVVLSILPKLSVTVRLAVQVPAAYVWLVPTPAPVAPSPNFQAWDETVPGLAVDPAPENCTVSGAVPVMGVASIRAVKFWLPPPGPPPPPPVEPQALSRTDSRNMLARFFILHLLVLNEQCRSWRYPDVTAVHGQLRGQSGFSARLS